MEVGGTSSELWRPIPGMADVWLGLHALGRQDEAIAARAP